MKPPVVLQNIRLHGLGDVVDTRWITVGKTITFFELPAAFASEGFTHTLQSVNPPSGYRRNGIFQNYPQIIRQGKYQKRVRPEKRTVAFAIFVAQPGLVTDLAEITPHLYETDRIEIGRRLDYSRWVNFVEIASSTRWSEIDVQLLRLADRFSQSLSAELRERLAALEKRDRIEGTLSEDIDQWLAVLASAGEGSETEEIEELRFAVNRWHHFREAKQKVRNRLPVFVSLGNGGQEFAAKERSARRGGAPASQLDRLVAEHRRGDGYYIIMVDEPSLELDRRGRQELRRHAVLAAEYLQILYFADFKDDSQQPEQGTRVRLEEMILS